MKRIVLWSKKAVKQIRKIDRKDARKIVGTVDILRETEKGLDIKKLTKHTYDYRLRIGNYRVLFNKTTSEQIIIYGIEEVGHRKRIY